MAKAASLTTLLVAIANLHHNAAVGLLTVTPSLATAGLARSDEFFLAERRAQVYEGDTALHAAAFSYDPEIARELQSRGADIRARNRRGGSTASDLANWTTGRGGTDSAEAKAEQRAIFELLRLKLA